MASAESKARLDRTTCFEGAGRLQPHSQPTKNKIASALTPYSIRRKRLLSSHGFDTTVEDGAKEGLFKASANSCADAKRSAGTFCNALETAASTCVGTLRR